MRRRSSSAPLTRELLTSRTRSAQRLMRSAASAPTTELQSVHNFKNHPPNPLPQPAHLQTPRNLQTPPLTGPSVAGMGKGGSSCPGSRTTATPPSRESSLTCVSSTGQSLSTLQSPHSPLLRTLSGQRVYVGGASLIGPNKLLTVAHKFWVV